MFRTNGTACSGQMGQMGQTAPSSGAAAFVDDHILMGHATSCQCQADKLTALNDKKTGFKIVTLGEAVAALGLEMLF